MLKYELFKETENQTLYRYYPEGGSDFGVVFVDKKTNKYGIEKLAKTDKYKRYAFHMFSYIRKFISKKTFEKSGTIVWY